ncbi:MAG TPA: hypothetical protein VNW97_17250 [Candidatus Saccharimonadales bacterium]|jgi:hypothetical protein|nr:hypothetical protein [Candidatus Saccharimonadales bacterium]
MPINKRRAILNATLCGAMIGLLVFAVSHKTQIRFRFLAWKVQREQPLVAVLPRPLNDVSVSQDTGVTLSHFGYQFDAPWDDVEKIDLPGGLFRVAFLSGRVIAFMDPAHEVNAIKVMKDDAAQRGEHLEDTFSPEAIASNYAWLRSRLTVTPSQISFWTPPKQVVQYYVFLNLKGVMMQQAETGLFSIQTQRLRGFQMGDPLRAAIHIDVFDDQDRHFEFWIGAAKEKHTTITQAEVNRVLQSLRPVAENKSLLEGIPNIGFGAVQHRTMLPLHHEEE